MRFFCNEWRSLRTIIITYTECVLVAIFVQHAMCIYHIVICGLSCCMLFFHIIWKTKRFSKNIIEYKIIILNFCEKFVWNISHSGKSWVKYNYKCTTFFISFSDFHEILIFTKRFRKIRKYQISRKSTQWNPSCSTQTDGSRERRTWWS
jgi:hypothetical protein